MYRQKFDSRWDESNQYSRSLCFRVKNIKKNENESLEVVREFIRKLSDEADLVIPDACSNHAHQSCSSALHYRAMIPCHVLS